MAPTDRATFEWQTREIINCLLEDEDEDELGNRQLDGCMETDSADHFDAVLIADKLKNVADSLNDDVKFKAVLSDLKKAAAQEAVDAAFSHGVEVLCQTQAPQSAEVAPEMHLIGASVALMLCVKKSIPELKNKVKSAMLSFLTKNVDKWVDQQGGWVKVACVSD